MFQKKKKIESTTLVKGFGDGRKAYFHGLLIFVSIGSEAGDTDNMSNHGKSQGPQDTNFKIPPNQNIFI